MNITTTLVAIVALSATPTLTLAQMATEHCKNFITDTGRYLPGFAEVVLEGPPLIIEEGPDNEGWTVAHDTFILEFEDRVEMLTSENTHPGALADYIGTTLLFREKGHEAFGVITDEADGYRLVLIQPQSRASDGKFFCTGSVLRQ